MPELFISYSRKQIAFVKVLYEKLISDLYSGEDGDASAGQGERKRSEDAVWVDWEGIPPTREWLQEIYAGIEACHGFVFVISPDSAASEVCGLELQHALELNKRIIPIVRTETDRDALPERMRAINWIFFREADDFDRSFAKLKEGISTDWDYAKAHTNYLLKAREWRDSGRRSKLLRGKDLPDAERWLAKGYAEPAEDEKAQPAFVRERPSELHAEFIRESRRWYKIRTAMWGSGAAAVIIGIVAGSWLYERRGIENRIDEAEPKDVNEDLFETTLLAVDALTRAERIWLRSDRAQTVLRSNLKRFPTMIDEWKPKGFFRTAKLSPDGGRIATYEQDRICLWSRAPGAEICRTLPATVLAMAFHPSGNRLFVSTRDSKTYPIDLPALTLREELALTHSEAAVSLAFSPASERPMLAAAVGHKVEIWDETAVGFEAAGSHGFDGSVRDVTIGLGGRYLAAANQTVEDGEPKFEMSRVALDGSGSRVSEGLINLVQPVAFSPDGLLIAVATGAQAMIFKPGPSKMFAPAHTISLIGGRNTTKGPITTQEPGAIKALAFNANGSWLATGTTKGMVGIWRYDRDDLSLIDREIVRMSHPGVVDAIEFNRSKDVDEVVTMSWPPPDDDHSLFRVFRLDDRDPDTTDPQALVNEACRRVVASLWPAKCGELLAGAETAGPMNECLSRVEPQPDGCSRQVAQENPD